MLRGIIFDLGNTLMVFNGDEQAVIRDGAAAMADWYLQKKHISIDRESLISSFIQARQMNSSLALENNREITAEISLSQALKAIQAPGSATAYISDAIRVFFEPEEIQYQLCDGVLSLLPFLKNKGLKVGLFSNATDDPLIQRLVNRLGLRPYLSPVFTSAGVGWRKPHPFGLRLIADRWGLPPSSIAMVGDMPGTDILGAQRAGMHSVLFTKFPYTDTAVSSDIIPEECITSLETLKELIVCW